MPSKREGDSGKLARRLLSRGWARPILGVVSVRDGRTAYQEGTTDRNEVDGRIGWGFWTFDLVFGNQR